MQRPINEANAKLEKVKIVKRGNKLILRATLPPKPGDGSKNKQYTLSPGFNANEEGLKLTLVEAQRIEADLIYGRFSWDLPRDQLTIEKAIAEFEKDYWQRKEKTINRTNNYKYDYLNHFLFLPQDQILTPELLKKALDTTKPDSRKRRGMAIAYSALLNYFEIQHDLNKYKGNYKPSTKRIIPTEEEIDYYWENNCKSPQWKWIYGIIACYGIRPSEIWHLEMSLMNQYPPILKVREDTKTGERIVLPLPDEKRVINWNLQEQIMPKINTDGKSNQELGGKISQKFNELGIPSPYHFRDAYAIRGLVMDYSSTAMCKWMGHTTYPNLVLTRGLVNIDLFYIWYQKTSQGLIQQLNGTILLLNDRQIPKMWWTVKKAYPVKWEGPQLNASSNNIAVEKIELVHQGISKFGRFSG